MWQHGRPTDLVTWDNMQLLVGGTKNSYQGKDFNGKQKVIEMSSQSLNRTSSSTGDEQLCDRSSNPPEAVADFSVIAERPKNTRMLHITLPRVDNLQ